MKGFPWDLANISGYWQDYRLIYRNRKWSPVNSDNTFIFLCLWKKWALAYIQCSLSHFDLTLIVDDQYNYAFLLHFQILWSAVCPMFLRVCLYDSLDYLNTYCYSSFSLLILLIWIFSVYLLVTLAKGLSILFIFPKIQLIISLILCIFVYLKFIDFSIEFDYFWPSTPFDCYFLIFF